MKIVSTPDWWYHNEDLELEDDYCHHGVLYDDYCEECAEENGELEDDND